jgi:hypothetical protein
MPHDPAELAEREAARLAALLGWRSLIEKLGNGGNELWWRERLRQHDAVRDAFGCPIVSVFSAHVNNGKVRVDFSSVLCDVPPVEFARTKIDVRDKRTVFAFGGIKQLNGIFPGRSYYSFKSTLTQAVLDKVLNNLVVFNDQNTQLVFHSGTSAAPQYERAGYTRGRDYRSEESVQNAHKWTRTIDSKNGPLGLEYGRPPVPNRNRPGTETEPEQTVHCHPRRSDLIGGLFLFNALALASFDSINRNDRQPYFTK